jgi:hypothetical protein
MSSLCSVIANDVVWNHLVSYIGDARAVLALASAERHLFFYTLGELLRDTRAAWVAFKLIEADRRLEQDEEDGFGAISDSPEASESFGSYGWSSDDSE